MDLPADFLTALIAEWTDAQTVGVLLGGSYARGDAGPFSDVDLLHFVPALPEHDSERYSLYVRCGRLISLSTTTIEAEQAKLTRPENAIFAVPGLRQARVLLDPTGALAALKQAAQDFNWQLVQSAADRCASETLMGFAEEAHKVLAGFVSCDEGMLLPASWALVMGMARVVAVHHGLLVRTENSYFAQVQDLMGLDSAWSHYFRLAAGFSQSDSALTPVQARGRVALWLYRETAHHLQPIVTDPHWAVIAHTLVRIEETLR